MDNTGVNRDTTVLFTWKVNERLKKYIMTHLNDVPHLNLIFPKPQVEILLEHAPKADILVGWRVKDEIKLAAKKMKLYINPGVGIRHHIEFFRKLNLKREVLLINGHGNNYFTAQHAVAMLLSLMNKIIIHHNWMVDGHWRMRDEDAKSVPLRYRRIGLLGYGAINKQVHKFLKGFNVEFSVLRRHWPKNEEGMPTSANKYLPSDLDLFLKEIDILIIAVPETSETIGLIGTTELNKLGAHSILVNVSRGSVVNEKDLYEALVQKKITGACIDVWYEYDPKPDTNGSKFPYHFPFHELNNVVLSPHRAASPFDDLERWNEVIENIKRFNRGESHFLNV
ncbi:MAG: NAD(P)-dependent oxidoreductase, partial [Candidatus Hodarchaeales archaeon]